MFGLNDTICAVGTAVGNSGINIIRISGEAAKEKALEIFSPLKKKKKGIKPRYMYLGEIYDGDVFVDRVLGVYFKGPFSYTGEDVFEIHCHGGVYASRKIIELLISHGVRPAQSGEFSKRAFLNGKMDLSQAEGVADQIGALSEKGAKNAALQMKGRLSEEISGLQGRLTDVIAQIEAGVEYPEENLEDQITMDVKPELLDIKINLQTLQNSYKQGKILKEGARITILGKPNVGKSSLMNAIFNTERVIVSDVPGTTRDVVTEYFIYKGIPMIFSDTAGIRETEDKVERIGVDRSRKALVEADIILFLLDSSDSVSKDDLEIYKEAKEQNSHMILVINKSDLNSQITPEEIKFSFSDDFVVISAKNNTGVDMLLERIYNIIIQDESSAEGNIITNSRHEYAISRAIESITDAIEGLENEIGLDLVSIDLHDAWSSIGEITGETLDETIIDRIFEKFCLGK